MGFAAKRTICEVAVIALLLWMIISGQANAQDQQGCHTLRIDPASFLEQCGDRLRSFALSLNDIRRTAGSGAHGGFYFNCPIEALCVNEPEILGWFIDEKSWARSARDQKAIFEVLQQAPRAGAARLTEMLNLSKSLCEVFDVEIAGLPGRGACYPFRASRSSAVVIVSADADIGMALIFQQLNTGWEDLRKKALSMVSRFSVERASGDAALLRWMK